MRTSAAGQDDLDLVRRCVSGRDEAAWQDFLQEYSATIWTAIRSACRTYSFSASREDLEDLFHSVILALVESDFHKLRQFRSENDCSLRTWLAVVASRMTIDAMRRDKGHLYVETVHDDRDLLLTIADKGPLAADLVEQKRQAEELNCAVAALPDQDRLLFCCLFEDGLDPAEAGRMTGLTPDAVYVRKNRIIGKLKKYLKALQENGSRSV